MTPYLYLLAELPARTLSAARADDLGVFVDADLIALHRAGRLRQLPGCASPEPGDVAVIPRGRFEEVSMA